MSAGIASHWCLILHQEHLNKKVMSFWKWWETKVKVSREEHIMNKARGRLEQKEKEIKVCGKLWCWKKVLEVYQTYTKDRLKKVLSDPGKSQDRASSSSSKPVWRTKRKVLILNWKQTLGQISFGITLWLIWPPIFPLGFAVYASLLHSRILL